MIILFVGELYSLVDIEMFDNSVQTPATSPCSVDNGGCEQLCFSYPGGTEPVCHCSYGSLASDGKGCECMYAICMLLIFICDGLLMSKN